MHLLKDIPITEAEENPLCRCGEVIRGVAEPTECPLFKRVCNPSHPVGPCMVSSEGTCSAYYKYAPS
jgi:hydrogenase expression/formation protein HypD